MAGNEYKITDVIDQKATDEIEKFIRNLNEAKKAYAELAKEIGKASQMNPSSMKELNEMMEIYRKKNEEVAAVEKQMAKTQKELVVLCENLMKNISKLAENTERLNSSFGKYTSNVSKATTILDEYSTSQEKGNKSTENASDVMKRASDATRLASKEYSEIIKTVTAYDSEAAKLNRNITEHKTKLDSVRKSLNTLKKEYDSGRLGQEKYNSEREKLLQSERELSTRINQENALLRTHEKVIVSTAGSYNEMSAAVLQLEKRYKSINAFERDGASGGKILADISRLKNELKSIDASMGNYQRNVGNYASGWNGLNMGIQQVARELPSLAMGWNTFFIAISNNIPILADEIKKARIEYELMKKSGQTATPVWKQVLGSILSWQTALVVGVTLLSLYGKEIVSWVGTLIKGKNALDTVDEAMDGVIEKMKSQDTGIGEQISLLNKLQKDWDKLGDNLNRKKEFIKENKENFDKLGVAVSDVTDAENILVINTDKFIEALELRAKATAASNLAVEQYEKAFKEGLAFEKEFGKGTGNMWDYWNATIDALSSYNNLYVAFNGGFKDMVNKQRDARAYSHKMTKDELTAEASFYDKVRESIEKELDALLKSIGVRKKDKGDSEEYVKYMANIRKQIADLSVSLIEDEHKRNLAAIEKDYEERIKAIKGHTKEEEQLRSQLGEERQNKIDEENKRFSDVQRQQEENLIQNKLDAINEGSDEELTLRLNLLELQKLKEISKVKENGEEIAAIIRKYEKLKDDARAENAKNKADEIAGKYSYSSLLDSQEMQKQLKEEAQLYAQGVTNRETYESNILRIQQEYARRQAELAMESIEKQLGVEDLDPKVRVKLEEELTKAKIALSKEETATILENNKKQEDSEKKKIEKVQEYLSMASEALNNINALGNAMFESRIQKLEEESEANQDAYDKEEERMQNLAESGVITEEEAEARKRAAKAKTEAREEELEKKKAALQRKQAIWDKANTIAQIGLATALAIMKVVTQPWMVAFVSAMGAVQLATAIATPIPKYAKGTDNHKGGLAIVGDGGKNELVKTPKGVWVTPDIPTLVNIPKGSVVLPDIKPINNVPAEDLFVLERKLKEAKEQGIIIYSNADTSRMERGINETVSVLKKMMKQQDKLAKDAEYREYIRRNML